MIWSVIWMVYRQRVLWHCGLSGEPRAEKRPEHCEGEAALLHGGVREVPRLLQAVPWGDCDPGEGEVWPVFPGEIIQVGKVFDLKYH